MTYAVVELETGLVINSAVWDGVADWSPGDGLMAVAWADGAAIGGLYADGVFTPPASLEPA